MTASITAGMIMNAVTATVPAGIHPRRLIPETDAAEDITDITDITDINTPRNGLCRRGVLVFQPEILFALGQKTVLPLFFQGGKPCLIKGLFIDL